MPKEFFKSLCWALGLHGVLLGVLLFSFPFLARSVFSFDREGGVIKVSLVSREWSPPSFLAKTQKINSPGRSKIQKNPRPESIPSVPEPISDVVESPARPKEDQAERKEPGPGISFSSLLNQTEGALGGNNQGRLAPPGGNGKEALASISSVKGPRGGPSEGPVLAIPRYGLNREPYYPVTAREQGWQGTALLKVLVLKNGTVGSLEILRSSGYALLDRSALKAVKEWKFVPAQKDGQPIEMGVEIPVTFRLE
jgi:protein TonB